MLTMFAIATPIYALGAWALYRWRKEVVWHNHLILIVFALGIGSNVALPPAPGDHLYGLVVGVISGLVLTAIYLAIVGLISVSRKGRRNG